MAQMRSSQHQRGFAVGERSRPSSYFAQQPLQWVPRSHLSVSTRANASANFISFSLLQLVRYYCRHCGPRVAIKMYCGGSAITKINDYAVVCRILGSQHQIGRSRYSDANSATFATNDSSLRRHRLPDGDTLVQVDATLIRVDISWDRSVVRRLQSSTTSIANAIPHRRSPCQSHQAMPALEPDRACRTGSDRLVQTVSLTYWPAGQ